jgi:transcriptional regulator with XRE-family HTH domain
MSERALLRRRACLTQSQLARKSGVSAPRLCQWERGEIELRPEQIVRIAEVLHKYLSTPPIFNGAMELARALAPSAFEKDPVSVLP